MCTKNVLAAGRKSDSYQYCAVLCSCSSDPQGKCSQQEATARNGNLSVDKQRPLACSAVPYSGCRHPDPGLMVLPSNMEAEAREGIKQELRCTLSLCGTQVAIAVCDRRVRKVSRAVAFV